MGGNGIERVKLLKEREWAGKFLSNLDFQSSRDFRVFLV